MKKLNKAVLLALTLVTSGLVANVNAAGNAEAGKSKSSTCVACHGANGISLIPMYPNLAGQKEQYLVLQMKAFRDGTRKNMVMAPMAAGLSDQDIADLAAFYAGLNPAG